MISEKEYVLVEMRRKKALSELVRMSGLSYTEISGNTGVERRAVKRAADGEGIRFATAVRLEYFLTRYLASKEKKQI